jgi:hypothetical protein
MDYDLDPARAGEKLDQAPGNHIEGVLRPFESSAWQEFLAFRQSTGAFYNASCWKAKIRSLFWLEAVN